MSENMIRKKKTRIRERPNGKRNGDLHPHLEFREINGGVVGIHKFIVSQSKNLGMLSETQDKTLFSQIPISLIAVTQKKIQLR